MAKAVMNELIRRTQDEVRGDNLVHSRMLISDDRELLISSADLTRDQLYDEFNAGIYTRDPEVISQAIEFFDEMWKGSDPLSTEFWK
jgi:phosphatidylserine/phosphatidylglycerophosphate/cardiolipin synthase-like enzyme